MDHITRTIVIASASLITMKGAAQCPFDPTVLPNNLILCPNTQDTLTTQVYDSYQWYKDGAPIPGAIGQTWVVDAFNDGGSMFSVEATTAGCTEMSPAVLVDGWAFLPPTVMTTGADFLFITPDYTIYCEGDTVLLVMMLPYDTLIQWTDGGVPIPGATDDTLVVTTGGQFSASGAPAICPGFVQQLGVQIGIEFLPPTQPVISMTGADQLCADPPGLSYQWYLDSLPIPGSDSLCITITALGVYTVYVTYDADCSILSEGYIADGVPDRTTGDWSIAPVPASGQVTISWTSGTTLDRWELIDATGRIVRTAPGPALRPATIDVSALSPGQYWLNAPGMGRLPVTVAR